MSLEKFNLVGAQKTVRFDVSHMTLSPGQFVTVCLQVRNPERGMDVINVELHVDQDGEPRVLLKPEHMNVVYTYDEVY